VFKFTDNERATHSSTRALSTDASGREVLVGLDYEETTWYVQYLRTLGHGQTGPESERRFRELNDRHEMARMQVIVAEVESRTGDHRVQ
jgi:hypothetical protein